ncbi:MAG: TetR/AcrR family transcriptional regulator [Halioglobus sp.]|nr:TetR/AcrR family transcriptional regulator [Halioglobus sp.]
MPRRQFNALDYSDPMLVRILDAGEQCIRRFGIRRTSMGEIARVGKLSRGSIYRYFGTKEALVEGIIRRQQQDFLNRTEAKLEQESSLADKVTLAILVGRKDMQEGMFGSLAEIEPETLAMMFLDPRFYRRSLSFWPQHIRMAQAAGEIDAELDVDLVADMVVRLAASLVMVPRMGVQLKTRKALRQYLQQMLKLGPA